jgi:hypothetical protein
MHRPRLRVSESDLSAESGPSAAACTGRDSESRSDLSAESGPSATASRPGSRASPWPISAQQSSAIRGPRAGPAQVGRQAAQQAPALGRSESRPAPEIGAGFRAWGPAYLPRWLSRGQSPGSRRGLTQSGRQPVRCADFSWTPIRRRAGGPPQHRPAPGPVAKRMCGQHGGRPLAKARSWARVSWAATGRQGCAPGVGSPPTRSPSLRVGGRCS